MGSKGTLVPKSACCRRRRIGLTTGLDSASELLPSEHESNHPSTPLQPPPRAGLLLLSRVSPRGLLRQRGASISGGEGWLLRAVVTRGLGVRLARLCIGVIGTRVLQAERKLSGGPWSSLGVSSDLAVVGHVEAFEPPCVAAGGVVAEWGLGGIDVPVERGDDLF